MCAAIGCLVWVLELITGLVVDLSDCIFDKYTLRATGKKVLNKSHVQ